LQDGQDSPRKSLFVAQPDSKTDSGSSFFVSFDKSLSEEPLSLSVSHLPDNIVVAAVDQLVQPSGVMEMIWNKAFIQKDPSPRKQFLQSYAKVMENSIQIWLENSESQPSPAFLTLYKRYDG
jgi:hypothetical protein